MVFRISVGDRMRVLGISRYRLACAKPYGCEAYFAFEVLWVVYSSSVYEDGVFHEAFEGFGF